MRRITQRQVDVMPAMCMLLDYRTYNRVFQCVLWIHTLFRRHVGTHAYWGGI